MFIAKLEAAYYLFMGAWPILHLRSFEAITGPKIDTWLVKSIAWLFIVVGVQLWLAGEAADVAILGIGIAAVIGGADIYYGFIQRRISRVYLLDVIPQALFIVGWLVWLL